MLFRIIVRCLTKTAPANRCAVEARSRTAKRFQRSERRSSHYHALACISGHFRELICAHSSRVARMGNLRRSPFRGSKNWGWVDVRVVNLKDGWINPPGGGRG